MQPKKLARRLLLGLAALLIIALIAMTIWAKTGTMAAEEQPLAAVKNNPAITWHEDSRAITLSPAHPTAAPTTGLVFYPGAKVHADAYAATLAPLVDEEGLTVVITKPILGLALFDLRGLGSFTTAAPNVTTWLVGGHSLGGVRACMLAPNTAGLILFASYCSNDLSEDTLPVVSISGSNDGLSTPDKVAAHRDALPADAHMVEIPGANHADFGSYGPQPGDGESATSDDAVRQAIVAAIQPILSHKSPVG